MHTEDSQSLAMFEQGLGLIGEGKIDEALAIARQLEERRFTGCFELDYRAHLARGEEGSALEALEHGVKTAPEVWYLWKLIGIHHSDREAWDASRAAFEKALACPWVDTSDIHCNLAILESRGERPQEARSHIEQVVEPGALAFARTVEIDLLRGEGRAREAITAGRAWLEEQSEGDQALRAEVHAKVAEALRLAGEDAESVEAELSKGIALDNSNPRGARIVRELRGAQSRTAQMWRLVVQGIVRTAMPATDEGRKPFGFFTTWFVVAEDQEQAMGFIRRFEPEERYAELKVGDAVAIQPAGDALLGVYEQRGGYTCFPLDQSPEEGKE
jgi:tetratricopeptide (TPR) repeat protein